RGGVDRAQRAGAPGESRIELQSGLPATESRLGEPRYDYTEDDVASGILSDVEPRLPARRITRELRFCCAYFGRRQFRAAGSAPSTAVPMDRDRRYQKRGRPAEEGAGR